ncbi:hypothetical protein [Bacteroides ihuae]|uniref:hypothetical protein n=1 Tax=Bacteroides ihuae TaxID=1852362 RepID=UPI0008D9997A|nr:hypothetical protein [Bacteroides ihuae]
MKNVFGDFLYSTNRNIYIKLSLRYKVWPWRVYALAHGSRSKGRKDGKVLKALQKLGIISDVKTW